MTISDNTRRKWEGIKGSNDLPQALFDHFEFLSSRNTKKTLQNILSRATRVKILKRGLVVDFGGGQRLICSKPADLRSFKGFPASFRAILKHHRLITLESDGLALRLGDNGLLDTDAYDDPGLKGHEVHMPLVNLSDCWIFHPTRKHQGEAALGFANHETARIEKPAGTSLTSIFITQVAEILQIDTGGTARKAPSTKSTKSNNKVSLKWEYESPGPVYAPLRTSAGLILVNTADSIHALDAESGKRKWQWKGTNRTTGLCGEAGYALVATHDPAKDKQHRITALDANTGKARWSYDYNCKTRRHEPCYITPLSISGNSVFFASSAGELMELSLETGKALHKHRVSKMGVSGPLAFTNKLIIMVCGSNDPDTRSIILAYDPKAKKVIWEHEDEITGPPRVFGDKVYYYNYKDIVGLDLKEGKRAWAYDAYDDITALSVQDDLLCYGSSINLHAIDMKKTIEAWHIEHKDWVKGGPAIIDNTIYITGEDKYLYAYDLHSGTLNWRFRTRQWAANTPLMLGNTLYLCATDGFVYALDIPDQL